MRRDWTPQSVFGVINKDSISDTARKMSEDDGGTKKPIAYWTTACGAMYAKLTTAEQDVLAEQAVRWNKDGPDAKWKPM